ncbi:hypothetical protein MPSEU_000308500 [Mayamaea pseudoterrestris]|nr:hypothetical protein MPSEU_000308500 [Mayamaea pseudoterrestris]
MSPHDDQQHIDEVKATDELNGQLQATLAMCRHCFDVVIQRLHEEHESLNVGQPRNLPYTKNNDQDTADAQPDFVQDLQDPNVTCPLFVTWDKRRSARSHHSFELRGCLGSLSPQPLVPAIGEYALASAFRDKRFPPIQKHEVEHLRVAVSLLVNYESCMNVWDWIVGKHGIVISWHGPDDRRFTSTYLPEVASDQKWDQKTAVESLIRKAGWSGAVTEALLMTIQCTRYQSSKLRLTYEEYMAHCRAGDDVVMLDVNAAQGYQRHADAREASGGKVDHCRIS